MNLDLVGQQSRAPVAFIPPVSVEDRPLHWILVRSQTYYPEHILAYGSEKTCYSLVMGSGSFRTDCVTEPTNYMKLSKKIIHRSRRFSKLKPV
jgi:hypothetical protein